MFQPYRISKPTMEEISLMTPVHVPMLENPMAPIHSFTKQTVPSMYQESLTLSHLISMT